MASDGGNSFPFTALSIVAIFLSTAFLGQRAFDLWRPAETSVRKHVELPDPPVEARLWEDPLTAMSRFHDRIREACDRAGGDRAACEARHIATEEVLKERLTRLMAGDRVKVTVMAVLVPGAALVGTEEARRRFRYAVLSGLNREGFNPDDSEHMGLLRTRHRQDFAATSGAPIDIAYETLHRWGTPDGTVQERRAVLLWIDDSKFRPRWLSALVRMFGAIAPDAAELRILGPVNSDSLAKAVWNDSGQWAAEAARAADPAAFAAHLRRVERLTIASPLATATSTTLGLGPCAEDCVEPLMRKHAAEAARILRLDDWDANAPVFRRTVATDDKLIGRFVQELRARGLDACRPGRVVLISERDLIYARHFGDGLKDVLTCETGPTRLRLWTYSYFRGLDGATPERSAEQARTIARTSNPDRNQRPPIEWPEGQAQEDYVRRLVHDIRTGNRGEPVMAIGLIGLEVHDKLLLAQALRETFSDRPLFMADLDARMIHPITSRYTRNVLVASSLALQVDEAGLRCLDRVAGPVEKGGAPARVVDRSIPFRDAYQTSMFLAARYAVATPDEARQMAKCLPALLATPALFELGRNGLAELPPQGLATGEAGQRRAFALAVAAFFAVLAVVMLFGMPGPAMSAVRGWLFPSFADGPAEFAWSKAIVAAVEWAALWFAAGVVLELAIPGACGDLGMWILAAAGALFSLAFLYPGTGWVQSLRTAIQMPGHVPDAGPPIAGAALRVAAQAALFAGGLAALWWLAVPRPAADALYEPFSLLNGVSAWPSQLIRTLMIVLFAWFLDFAWFKRAATARNLRNAFFRTSQAGQPAAAATETRWSRVCTGMACLTVWFWRPRATLEGGRVDGMRLWEAYHRMMDDGPRLARLVFWLAVAVALTLALTVFTNTLSDGAYPEIPARGVTDRNNLFFTQIAGGLCLVILLILVGDETILTWRFVSLLRQGRTVYPAETVRRFAAELGPDLADKAAEPIAARPRDRGPGSTVERRNSILDDWIDARLLADHTAAVGPLIVYPFILVALVIVARSQIFDNWDMGPGVLAVLACYLLWSIGMAALLNHGAERARRKALEGMQADQLWLAGSASKDLSGSFGDLVDSVKGLRKGAFAPFFEQPLVRAMLVPLGGAGGIQLLEFLLYARS